MKGIIVLKGVTKSFGDQVVLRNISLEIPKGSITAIVGKSGSGKTTLLNIMGLLEAPDAGEITIAGVRIKVGSLTQRTLLLRSKISYLFQNFALVDNATVDYNLDIGLRYVKKNKREKDLMKERVLVEVGLSSSRHKKIFQLSGGEQQRVAVARILLKPCEVILADEPTGSLDDGNAKIVLAQLKCLKDLGKTIVIVTHDRELAAVCDHVVGVCQQFCVNSKIPQ